MWTWGIASSWLSGLLYIPPSRYGMALGIELPLDIVRCRNHSGDVGGSPSRGVAERSFAIPPL